MNVNSHVYIRLSGVYNIFCYVFEIKNIVIIKTTKSILLCRYRPFSAAVLSSKVDHPKEDKVWFILCIVKNKIISAYIEIN